MRHEIKSRLSPAEVPGLRARLQAVMTRDPHARADGTYDIHSVYLDTPSRRALAEKQVGMPVRHKYRVRYYNDNRDFFRLERKSKVGSLCDKVGCSLTREEADLLEDPEKRNYEGDYSPRYQKPYDIAVYLLIPSVLQFIEVSDEADGHQGRQYIAHDPLHENIAEYELIHI